MEPVRLGLVGCGLVSAKHIEASKSINNGKLIALCDINPDRRTLAEELSIPFFTDYREMIAQAGLEGDPLRLPVAVDAEIHRDERRILDRDADLHAVRGRPAEPRSRPSSAPVPRGQGRPGPRPSSRADRDSRRPSGALSPREAARPPARTTRRE